MTSVELAPTKAAARVAYHGPAPVGACGRSLPFGPPLSGGTGRGLNGKAMVDLATCEGLLWRNFDGNSLRRMPIL